MTDGPHVQRRCTGYPAGASVSKGRPAGVPITAATRLHDLSIGRAEPGQNRSIPLTFSRESEERPHVKEVNAGWGRGACLPRMARPDHRPIRGRDRNRTTRCQRNGVAERGSLRARIHDVKNRPAFDSCRAAQAASTDAASNIIGTFTPKRKRYCKNSHGCAPAHGRA